MGRINWGRVVLGGLAAGILISISEMILNGVVLRDEGEAVMRELNLDPEGGSVAVWILYAFVLGILAVWVYAAIRPRYGPGAKTAVIAGFAVWLLASFLSSVAMLNIGLFPASLLVVGLIWGLIELILATLLGAWIYREAPA